MKKLGKTLIQVQYGASIVAALMLLLMIGYEVFARYVLKSSLMGIEELMLFPIIWLYMLGGANASYEKSHIECGILTLYIKKERSKLILMQSNVHCVSLFLPGFVTGDSISFPIP